MPKTSSLAAPCGRTPIRLARRRATQSASARTSPCFQRRVLRVPFFACCAAITADHSTRRLAGLRQLPCVLVAPLEHPLPSLHAFIDPPAPAARWELRNAPPGPPKTCRIRASCRMITETHEETQGPAWEWRGGGGVVCKVADAVLCSQMRPTSTTLAPSPLRKASRRGISGSRHGKTSLARLAEFVAAGACAEPTRLPPLHSASAGSSVSGTTRDAVVQEVAT